MRKIHFTLITLSRIPILRPKWNKYGTLNRVIRVCSKCQIDGENFIDFCDLLRKHELYRYFHFQKVSDKNFSKKFV